MELYTIGYEGLTPGEFWSALEENQVTALIDVRELPLSRKPGFAKTALANAAIERGIGYLHVPALGCPREIRYAYRADTNWDRYTERFLAYLANQQETLRTLAHRVEQERCCLLCFEADYNRCHRSYVANDIQTLLGETLTIRHLAVKKPAATVSAQPVLAGI